MLEPPLDETGLIVYIGLACFAVLVFSYSLISEKVARLSLSGPIVFVATGTLLGPFGLNWFSPTPDSVNGKALIDVTLALFLFVDAASADLGVLRKNWRIPGRMLLIGLPASICLGALAASWLFPSLSLYEAAILGTMLAATDAALGKAVVTNQSVPHHLREGLSAESGLNDGLCVPVLLLFIALEHGAAPSGGGLALELLTEELGIGLLVGAIIAFVAAKAIVRARAANSLGDVWQRTSVPALALLVFAVAQLLHGSGYIAAFVGGLCFRAAMKEDLHSLIVPAEGLGEVMAMFAWILFGLMLVPAARPLRGPESYRDTNAADYALATGNRRAAAEQGVSRLVWATRFGQFSLRDHGMVSRYPGGGHAGVGYHSHCGDESGSAWNECASVCPAIREN
jgi:NhaP-type Na+/H+ or K+/H+ antiporter